MASLNKVLLIGNLGSDPEIRALPTGAKVANFSIATSESYTDKAGQKQTLTEWHRIELWDGLAGIAEQYLKKGDPVYIEGRIRTEKWTDANGQEKTGVRIRATSMQMLGARGTGGGGMNAGPGAPMSAPAMPSSEPMDDLPF
ncbi:MAG: single-stranded DNA-binding protein [Spirosomataceae bacterium]